MANLETLNNLETLVESAKPTQTVQQRFELSYITASEIMDATGLTRPSVVNRMTNRFPPIRIGNTYIWERSPELTAFVEAWATIRKTGA